MFMRLKHIKAQTAIPAAIIALLLLVVVFYVMFATGNRFTEHLINIKEELNLFDVAKEGVKSAIKKP